MKSSFLASVGLHALALAIAFISFNSIPKSIESPLTEALPITLVPLNDTLSVQEGDKNEDNTNKPAPIPTTKLPTKPQAQNVGDGEMDIDRPLDPTEKQRENVAPPPVLGKPNAKPYEMQPQEKPHDTKPVETAQTTPNAESIIEKPLQPAPHKIEKPAVPKPEPVKQEQPKPEPVKQEQPKSEPVKQEEPKPEPVKQEQPKPEPVKPEQPKPEPEQPKPEPVKPEQPKPEPVKQEKPKPEPVKQEQPKPPVIKPAPKETVKKEIAPKSAEVKPIKPAKKIPVTPPQPPVKPSETRAKETLKPSSTPSIGEEIADIIKDSPQTALLDRTKTQGGGAKRSEKTAGFGATKHIGNDAHLGQTIGNIIKACMDSTWFLPSGFTNNGGELKVQAKFNLSPNGNIIGEPILTPIGGDPYTQRTMVTSSLTALKRCSPFKGLPPESYEKWRSIVINLNVPGQ